MKAITYAHYIINYCNDKERFITNIYIQKILYFIQLNFYKNYTRLAFDDETQAWEHGPVVENVYLEYSKYGGTPIIVLDNYDDVPKLSSDEKELINAIIDVCMKHSVWYLIELSHRDDTPWKKVYEEGKGKIIPKELIKEYAKFGTIKKQSET